MAFNRMSAVLSVLISRNFSKIFLRARRTLKFSHSLGQKQKWRHCAEKSALTPIADIRKRSQHVRFVPVGDIWDLCPAPTQALLFVPSGGALPGTGGFVLIPRYSGSFFQRRIAEWPSRKGAYHSFS
jgi:hypothetical protein